MPTPIPAHALYHSHRYSHMEIHHCPKSPPQPHRNILQTQVSPADTHGPPDADGYTHSHFSFCVISGNILAAILKNNQSFLRCLKATGTMVQHFLVMRGWDKKRSTVIFPSPWLAHQEARKGVNISSQALGEYGCSSKADVAVDMLGSCWARLDPSGLVRELTLSLPLSHKRGHLFGEIFLSQSLLLLSLPICKYIKRGNDPKTLKFS